MSNRQEAPSIKNVRKEFVTLMQLFSQLFEEDTNLEELSDTLEIIEEFAGSQKSLLRMFHIITSTMKGLPERTKSPEKRAKIKTRRAIEIYQELTGETFTEEQILEMFKKAND